MKAIRITAIALLALTTLASSNRAQGQDNDWIGTTGNWTDGNNWAFGSPAPALDGRAVVNNGGIVTVNSPVTSPTVLLGNGGANSGTLNISAGGNLNVTTGAGDPNMDPGAGQGNVLIGLDGGAGTLNMTGGALAVAGDLSTPTSGNAASTLSLSGNSSVTAATAFLDKNLSIAGSNVNFSVAGNAVFGLGGTHEWTIPATGAASTVSVGGDADLGGTLKLGFTGGAPAVGSTWNLIDSATVDVGEGANPSSFSFIDQSSVPGLQPGQAFSVSTVPGGSHGALTQLSLEQHPVLTVDRQTGAMQLKNFGSANSVVFDQYTIRSSTLGALNVGKWNSLQSQSLGTWMEANPSSAVVSELEQLGSQSIAGGAALSLGNAFQLGMPMALGDPTEDLFFEFTKVGDNSPTQGQIVYTGTPIGNVVLTVDPTTGEAQIRNNSPFTIDIDTYAIQSQAGSLLDDNGHWSSLDDRGDAGGGWVEANASVNQLSEIDQLDKTTLEPGTAYSLGTPFDTSGKPDLSFQFSLADEDVMRDGVVSYGSLPSSFTADFNNDGKVDGDDLNGNWQAAYGVNAAGDANFNGKSDGADFLAWQRQAGSGVAPNSSAVPEPTSALLLGSFALALAWRRKRSC